MGFIEVELRNRPEVEYRYEHLVHVLKHLWLLVENENPFVHKSLNHLYHSHLLNVNWVSDSHIEDDRFKYLLCGRSFKLFVLTR